MVRQTEEANGNKKSPSVAGDGSLLGILQFAEELFERFVAGTVWQFSARKMIGEYNGSIGLEILQGAG